MMKQTTRMWVECEWTVNESICAIQFSQVVKGSRLVIVTLSK